MKLTLGFSPCPNDTFIFDALIHHKIDTEGLDFDVFYDDVETLNQKAFRGELVPQDPNDEPATELLKRLAQSKPTPATRPGRARKQATA